jgi:AraC-like DNA-binding protein
MQLEAVLRLNKYDLRCTREAMEYIDKKYAYPLSAEELSLEVSLSIKKLQAGIQRETGYALHDYVLKVRIEKAKPLLTDTTRPIKSIADTVGFKTPSHFGEVFRKFTSLTPSAYRNL